MTKLTGLETDAEIKELAIKRNAQCPQVTVEYFEYSLKFLRDCMLYERETGIQVLSSEDSVCHEGE